MRQVSQIEISIFIGLVRLPAPAVAINEPGLLCDLSRDIFSVLLFWISSCQETGRMEFESHYSIVPVAPVSSGPASQNLSSLKYLAVFAGNERCTRGIFVKRGP